MDFIVYKVVKLQVVHNADSNGVIKFKTCSAVCKDRLTVLTVACLTKSISDVGLVRTVEYRCGNLLSELSECEAEVYLKNLSDVHSGRNAQRVKNYIKRSTVIKERHILLRKYSRNNALVTVTACHLIADGELSLLCDITAYNLIDTGA